MAMTGEDEYELAKAAYLGRRIQYKEIDTQSTVQELTPWSPRELAEYKEQSTLPPIPACRDCKHRSGSTCRAPGFGENEVNPIKGRWERKNLPRCRDMRSVSGACGIAGNLWRKAPPHKNYRAYAYVASMHLPPMAYLTFGASSLWALALVPTLVMSVLMSMDLADD